MTRCGRTRKSEADTWNANMVRSRRVLRWFFDHLYTNLAWAYDVVAWLASGGLWYEWTFVAEQFVQDGPVLEVGVGRGRLLRRLDAGGHTAIGIELSPQMVAAIEEYFAKAGRRAPIVQGDGCRLPFEDSTFQTLITTFPAPYVAEERTQREFARVLRPGGRWIWIDQPQLRSCTLRLGLYVGTTLLTQTQESVTSIAERLPYIPEFRLTVKQVPVGPSLIHVFVFELAG